MRASDQHAEAEVATDQQNPSLGEYSRPEIDDFGDFRVVEILYDIR